MLITSPIYIYQLKRVTSPTGFLIAFQDIVKRLYKLAYRTHFKSVSLCLPPVKEASELSSLKLLEKFIGGHHFHLR